MALHDDFNGRSSGRSDDVLPAFLLRWEHADDGLRRISVLFWSGCTRGHVMHHSLHQVLLAYGALGCQNEACLSVNRCYGMCMTCESCVSFAAQQQGRAQDFNCHASISNRPYVLSPSATECWRPAMVVGRWCCCRQVSVDLLPSACCLWSYQVHACHPSIFCMHVSFIMSVVCRTQHHFLPQLGVGMVRLYLLCCCSTLIWHVHCCLGPAEQNRRLPQLEHGVFYI